ncbi:hypothetical protein IFU00_01245 [Oxalobacteraceae sp. CFBP 8761]|nr:hypothetical protein [Oxalobacteraceae sp. CFBP 8761]
MKLMTRPMLNFKLLHSVLSLFSGIELMNMIRKCQFAVDGDEQRRLLNNFALVGMIRRV